MTHTMVRATVGLGVVAACAFVLSGRSTHARPVRAAFPGPAVDEPLATRAGSDTAVLSGGCFWGMQLVFEHVKGVTGVVEGYAGGEASTASYEQVSTGETGHAESVRIVYDPSQVSYGRLLQVYFAVAHDPTELNRQGPDVGSQYRSAIWYRTPAQERIARAYIQQLAAAKVFTRPIVTQVNRFAEFYPAEAYHQGYADNHPDALYIVINDRPKLGHLKSELPGLYREKGER